MGKKIAIAATIVTAIVGTVSIVRNKDKIVDAWSKRSKTGHAPA